MPCPSPEVPSSPVERPERVPQGSWRPAIHELWRGRPQYQHDPHARPRQIHAQTKLPPNTS
eukprot:1112497-Pyramimonas_sp.AAC.1